MYLMRGKAEEALKLFKNIWENDARDGAGAFLYSKEATTFNVKGNLFWSNGQVQNQSGSALTALGREEQLLLNVNANTFRTNGNANSTSVIMARGVMVADISGNARQSNLSGDDDEINGDRITGA